MDYFGRIAIEWYYGLRDSLRLAPVVDTILHSRVIREKFQGTFVFNGVLFLGLAIILKIINFLFFSNTKFEGVFTFFYTTCILIPIYLASFIVNTFWYGEIALEGIQIEIRKGNKNIISPTSDVVTRIYNEIISSVLVGFFFLQANLVRLIPVFGEFLYLFHMCFIYAFFGFAYKWGTEAQDFKSIIAFFEKHFSYFCGFGFFFTCCTALMPGLVSSGVYSLLFPVFELLSIKGTPPIVTKPIEGVHDITDGMRDYESHSIYQATPSKGKVTSLAYIRNFKYDPQQDSTLGFFTFAKFGIALTGNFLKKFYKIQ